MTDILVGEVSDTHDGALFDRPCELEALFELDIHNFIATLLVALSHCGGFILDLLDEEGTLEDVEIVLNVFFYFCVFRSSLPHTEHIVLLNVPDTVLGNCFNR